MANSEQPILSTFLKEGGIVFDNDDNGGLTYLGLAYNFWPKVKVWPKIISICLDILNQNGYKITEEDLKNLGTQKGKDITISQTLINIINRNLEKSDIKKEIVEFFKKEFWDVLNADNIISQSFADSMFDFGVNVGYKISAKKVQEILKVKADGIIGPLSTYVLNCELIENHHEIHTQFALAKIERYTEICQKNPNKLKYYYGWLNRTFYTYEHNYIIKDLISMIKSSNNNGFAGPKSTIKGYRSYMRDEEHHKALKTLIKIYEIIDTYNLRKITKEELLNKIAIELK